MQSRENRTDEKLLNLIGQGNEIAFSEFFDRHWESLLDVALKILKDAKYAEDCVQEIFIDFWIKRPHAIRNPYGYLYQATKYKCIDHIRKRRVPLEQLDHAQSITGAIMPDELMEFEQMHQMLDQSIGELPSQCSRIFRMSRFEQMSNKEIAEHLNLSVRTVESHITHAIKLIRLKLGNAAPLLLFIFPLG